VDSSGWVEFFPGGGPKADAFGKFLENPEGCTSSVHCVYEFTRNAAEQTTISRSASYPTHLDSMSASFLSIFFGRSAARVSLTTNLPMADAIIYATRVPSAQSSLRTRIHGLPGVTVL